MRRVSLPIAWRRALPLAGVTLLGCVFGARAEESDLGESIAHRVKEVFALSRAAVVKIQSTDKHGRIEGTGFYADPSGTIYTVVGVLGDGRNITVCEGARQLPASVVAVDPRTSVAIIKVEQASPFIPIGDSSKLEVASPLIAVGYPMDQAVTPAFGLVTSFDKEYLNRFFRTTHIRTNIPAQPGLGGAPALNFKGEVVGIVVASVDGAASCYVLPINAAEKMRSDLANYGELRPGWIGVSVEPADAAGEAADRSQVRVSNLLPFAPAAHAGLQEGDLLLRVGDVSISKPEDVFDASFYLTAGTDTTITVLRDGQEKNFTVRVAESPSAAPLPELSPLTIETVVAPTPTPVRRIIRPSASAEAEPVQTVTADPTP